MIHGPLIGDICVIYDKVKTKTRYLFQAEVHLSSGILFHLSESFKLQRHILLDAQDFSTTNLYSLNPPRDYHPLLPRESRHPLTNF